MSMAHTPPFIFETTVLIMDHDRSVIGPRLNGHSDGYRRAAPLGVVQGKREGV